jgi:hypothetical protein
VRPRKIAELQRMMIEVESRLRPGIEAMPGLINFYVGADEATSSLAQVSIWSGKCAVRRPNSAERTVA